MTLLLDLDGTLIDSRLRVYQLFVDLLDAEAAGGAHIGFDEYWELKRARRSNAWLLVACFGYSAERVAGFTARWMETIEAPRYLALDAKFPWTDASLELLGRQHALYVLTARQDEAAARAQLDTLGLIHRFADVLVTGQKCTKAELVRRRNIALVAGDALVGDTGDDVEAARELGVRSVAVLSGVRDRASLERYRPDHLCESLYVLAALL